ncbi:hypothetical protein EST38_g9759 [Candolleomyces aberdarensis]|uniref:Uncharacterized protein n=1 Tax=Candolleomyces aberdarensis TaxID=2316362 RepID=A0A4V1Q2S4_9AGAR|nr:hypothetical protein EST38_g9759 [Candolleomyces aberdarensis]
MRALVDLRVDLWLTKHQLSTWRAGLPNEWDFTNHSKAELLERALRDQVFTDIGEFNEEEQGVLQELIDTGRIHCDILELDAESGKAKVGYTFASPLHALYNEAMLVLYHRTYDLKYKGTIQELNIYDFVLNVFKKLSPSSMQRSPRYGYGMVQQSDEPKAQIHDEFYRCCHIHAHGVVRNYSRLGTQGGRVDFLIPSKRWAIELLREGDDIEKHYSRFIEDQGLHEWPIHANVSSFLLLDSRYEDEDYIWQPCPDLPCLYRVVFRYGGAPGSKTISKLEILDNNLKSLTELMLDDK